MSDKKSINLATEKYVNDMIENLESINGKSAYDVAVENGFEGTEEEWLSSLKGAQGEKGEDGKFNMEEFYELLQTEDKTIIGAINELFSMINNFQAPEGSSTTAQMYYGVINPENPIKAYSDITMNMLNSKNMTSTAPGERLGLSLGYVEVGTFIVVAIPAKFYLTVFKDNGFGGKVKFDTNIIGANGLDVKYNGVNYRLYGEFALVGGERKIYIEKTEDSLCGCECYDLTTDDIDEAMSDTFRS